MPSSYLYTLSLHDALPISTAPSRFRGRPPRTHRATGCRKSTAAAGVKSTAAAVLFLQPVARCVRGGRSEEHTSELQSRGHLVCRLLLEKKKKKNTNYKHAQ